MRKIQLKEDIEAFMTTFEKGSIFEEDEPYQGFNEDGSFTVCQGLGIYIEINKNQFEEI